MANYHESQYPVRADLAAIHAAQIDQLAQPGTWGSGAQRLSVAAEARQAGYLAGILEKPAGVEEKPLLALPEAVRKTIHQLAADPREFNEASYRSARDGGLSDEEYVEIVGIVSRIVDIDVFARGIGVPLRALPTPVSGAPSRKRPASAKLEHAWIPTVPNPPEGDAAANEIYEGKPKPYIIRALSLVPDEMRRHVELEEIQYLPLKNIMDPKYDHHEAFTRAQVEVVAGRVSAINECFY